MCADDDDQLSLWDARQPNAVFRLDQRTKIEEECGDEEFLTGGFRIGGVTDCAVDCARHFVYCSCSDGTL